MRKFKIFYSWQSDLPGSKTRNFIRECIDDAINLAQESEAVEAERDEATAGMTGSPNIVTTLFSKIDNCDLFIADLSLCFTEDNNKEKKSPNPNVLLELGYAVKTLGLERVICLCNTDYGNKYPFDIAHNRITVFSLEGRNRKEVSSDIARIIFINIRDLRKQMPRAKNGMAAHVIGKYDPGSHKVINALMPIEISKQEGYVLHNEELLEEAKELVTEILELTDKLKDIKDEKDEFQMDKINSQTSSIKTQAENIQTMAELLMSSGIPVVWRKKKEDKERIKKWIGIDVTDDFFDMGKLKRVAQLSNTIDTTLKGTGDEKVKYENLDELSYKLMLLDVRTNYLKTFEGMCFIPLAIQNVSSIQDTNISVLVKVEIGEIVEPDEHLIWNNYDGLQGTLCRDDEDKMDVGIICELFGLVEDGFIHIEDLPYDPLAYTPRTPIFTSYGLQQPDKTAEDYKQELEEFIASTGGKGYYEFDVANLRPGECRWLCCGMLIRPIDGKIKIHYQIHSKYSSGDLSDTLEMI